MSTRFDADSSSQIWDHLNALDDDIQGESATAADIRYMKQADGTLIVTARVTITIATAGTAVSAPVVFPIPFAALPRFSLASFSGAPSTTAPPVITLASGTTAGVTVWANRASTGAIPIDVTAIGRWK